MLGEKSHNVRPPSAGPDWDSARLADRLLPGSPTSPSPPAFLSVSPPAPPVLPWFLAALGAEHSPALWVPSSWENCYSFSRVDLLILRDCTASALITGSLTPSVIGDRPSHPISDVSRNPIELVVGQGSHKANETAP